LGNGCASFEKINKTSVKAGDCRENEDLKRDFAENQSVILTD